MDDVTPSGTSDPTALDTLEQDLVKMTKVRDELEVAVEQAATIIAEDLERGEALERRLNSLVALMCERNEGDLSRQEYRRRLAALRAPGVDPFRAQVERDAVVDGLRTQLAAAENRHRILAAENVKINDRLNADLATARRQLVDAAAALMAVSDRVMDDKSLCWCSSTHPPSDGHQRGCLIAREIVDKVMPPPVLEDAPVTPPPVEDLSDPLAWVRRLILVAETARSATEASLQLTAAVPALRMLDGEIADLRKWDREATWLVERLECSDFTRPTEMIVEIGRRRRAYLKREQRSPDADEKGCREHSPGLCPAPMVPGQGRCWQALVNDAHALQDKFEREAKAARRERDEAVGVAQDLVNAGGNQTLIYNAIVRARALVAGQGVAASKLDAIMTEREADLIGESLATERKLIEQIAARDAEIAGLKRERDAALEFHRSSATERDTLRARVAELETRDREALHVLHMVRTASKSYLVSAHWTDENRKDFWSMIARTDRYLAATPIPDAAVWLISRAANLLIQIRRVMKNEEGAEVSLGFVETILTDLNAYLEPMPQPAPPEAS